MIFNTEEYQSREPMTTYPLFSYFHSEFVRAFTTWLRGITLGEGVSLPNP